MEISLQHVPSLYDRTENHSEIREYLAVVGHIIKDTPSDIMSELETSHTYHYFQPLLLCNPPLLLKKNYSFFGLYRQIYVLYFIYHWCLCLYYIQTLL